MRLSPSISILRTQSDERLVALARDGSEAAFQAIVERYRRPLQRACRRVLSETRAEDAVQQAFMSAWMALERGDEVLNLRGWLLMIARNTSLNALRMPGFDYSELRESLDAGAAPQEELERREVMRQTLAGLAALPERQREALLRSAVAGVSYSDIAHDLGLSEGATRQLVLRARTTMRAAATAVVPWPLVQALASGGRTDATLRIADIVTAGGGAGATALVAKAGVVAVVAGGVAVGPAVVRHDRDVVPRANAATQQAPAPARTAAAVLPAPRRIVAASAPATGSSVATADRQRRRGKDKSDDHTSSGPGPRGETTHTSEHRRGSGHDGVGKVEEHRDDAERADDDPGSGSGHRGRSGDREGRAGRDDEPSGSQQPARITTEPAESAAETGRSDSPGTGSGSGSPASEEPGSHRGMDDVPELPELDE